MAVELIEAKLTGMNDDAFHRLGDEYFFYEYGVEFDAINPIGQAEGKQKSRGGTPDTTIRLKNGKFALIQYTTQEPAKKRAAFFAKLKSDLLACFDRSGIPNKDIDHIVLCCNSNPSVEQESQLLDIAAGEGLELRVVNLSTIARHIHSKYTFLSKDYWGLELDTYQVLPLPKFVAEYEKNGFATPLSNPFYFRQEELDAIRASISQQLITIVTGKPGVGKSKMVVEAISRELDNNESTIAYCLRNKNLPVLHDLRRYLTPGKSYIIYIDDVNQNLAQLRDVLTYHQESDTKLRIVLTVREYVFDEVRQFIKGYHFQKITIPVFEREQLKQIIKGEPFSIKHPAFVKRILEVAHGNARLAIILATVAKNKYLHELDNLTDVYDSYFQKISAEKGHLFSGIKLQVLGFVAFFKNINAKDPVLNSNLQLFGISETKFWETIWELELAEFVDVFTDRSLVRISDQILEGYVFYKCFFVDKALNYQVVLNECFPEHRKRISNTIIDANNTFGYQNLKDLVQPYITGRYHLPWTKEEDKLSFLNIFWMYMQEEGLYYASQCIEILDDKDVIMLDKLKAEAHKKHIAFQDGFVLTKDEKDPMLSLLSQYLLHNTSCFEPAVLLLFKYIRKRPHMAEKLVQFIKSHFAFNYLDEPYQYIRERMFSEILIRSLKKYDDIHSYIFLRLCRHFLKTNFRSTVLIGNVMHTHENDINGADFILEMRKAYWEKLGEYFPLYPKLARHTLKDIIDGFWLDYNEEVRKFDIPLIAQLMNKHFDMTHIADVVMANEFVQKLDKRKHRSNEVKQLKTAAANEQYKWYQAFDWNLYRNKERYDIEEDQPTFRQRFPGLKEKELISTFNFNTKAQYQVFLDFIVQCLEVRNMDLYEMDKSCKILFRHFIQNNPADFFAFLKSLLSEKTILQLVWPDTLLALLIEHYTGQIDEIETLLNNIQDEFVRQKLLIAFYSELPPSEINSLRCKNYSRVYSKLSGRHFLDFRNVGAYHVYQDNFLLHHLKLVYNQAIDGKCSFTLDRNFLITHHPELSGDSSFTRQLYFHLDQDNPHFDYNGETMLFLMDSDPEFFTAYIQSIIKDKKYKREDHYQLKQIWKTPGYLQNIQAIFDALHNHKYLSWEMENVLKDLFAHGHGSPDFHTKRTAFLTAYIAMHHNNSKRMATCFKVINASVQQQKDEFTLLLLSHSQDLEIFKKIGWTDDGAVLHGAGFNAGVRDEHVYRHMIQLITPLEPKLAYLGHLSYLNQQIDYARRSALIEYKWDFEDPN